MKHSITNILQQGENQTVEFKSTFSIQVVETLVTFANTKGGSVYIGVNDNAKAVGVCINNESIVLIGLTK